MSKHTIPGVSGLALACFLLPLAGAAAAKEPTAEIAVNVTAAAKDQAALKETPVLISLILNGEVVHQKETRVGFGPSFHVEPGVYDVRLEGDGLVTVVKRGIRGFDGKRTEIIGGPLQAGKGIHIVEYATGGLSREEVAERLAKLDAEVAELTKKIENRAR